MSVSRWERGLLEPSAETYIQLGYLAGDPDCWDFWRRAGLRSEDLMRVVPAIREQLPDNRLTKVQVVVADKSVSKKQISNLVAIPVLPVVAAAPGEEGSAVRFISSPARSSICSTRPLVSPSGIYTLLESEGQCHGALTSKRLRHCRGHVASQRFRN